MSIDDQLRSLTKNEITVLFYKCKGLKYEQIAARLDYGADWVQLHMSNVYTKLGFRKEMHWTKRKEILENEICPRLPKKLEDWVSEIPKIEPIEESREEAKADPQMLALVLYDEMAIEVTKGKALVRIPTKVISIPDPRRKPNRFMGLLRLIFFLVVVVIVGYFAFMFGKRSVPIAPVSLPTSILQVTPVPPTLTQEPTNIVPTDTLVPTDTPIPTDTPAPTPTTFVPPADGILFQDNFDNTMSPEWITYSGTWLVANGELTLLADEGGAYEWIGLNKPEWKNYVVSLKIKIPHQSSANQQFPAIAVRNDGSQSKYIGVPVDYFSKVYWAFIGSDQFDTTPIAGQNKDFSFDSGSTLELVVQGDIYTLRANGREVQRITIDGYNSGGISLGIMCAYECPSFDNLRVTYLP